MIDRAKAILRDLERDEEGLAQRILSEAPAAAAPPLERQGAGVQLGLFAAPSPIEEALRSADLDSMTPLRALTLLQELKDKL